MTIEKITYPQILADKNSYRVNIHLASPYMLEGEWLEKQIKAIVRLYVDDSGHRIISSLMNFPTYKGNSFSISSLDISQHETSANNKKVKLSISFHDVGKKGDYMTLEFDYGLTEAGIPKSQNFLFKIDNMYRKDDDAKIQLDKTSYADLPEQMKWFLNVFFPTALSLHENVFLPEAIPHLKTTEMAAVAVNPEIKDIYVKALAAAKEKQTETATSVPAR